VSVAPVPAVQGRYAVHARGAAAAPLAEACLSSTVLSMDSIFLSFQSELHNGQVCRVLHLLGRHKQAGHNTDRRAIELAFHPLEEHAEAGHNSTRRSNNRKLAAMDRGRTTAECSPSGTHGRSLPTQSAVPSTALVDSPACMASEGQQKQAVDGGEGVRYCGVCGRRRDAKQCKAMQSKAKEAMGGRSYLILDAGLCELVATDRARVRAVVPRPHRAGVPFLDDEAGPAGLSALVLFVSLFLLLLLLFLFLVLLFLFAALAAAAAAASTGRGCRGRWGGGRRRVGSAGCGCGCGCGSGRRVRRCGAVSTGWRNLGSVGGLVVRHAALNSGAAKK